MQREDIMKMVSRLITLLIAEKPEKTKRGSRKNKNILRNAVREAVKKKWNTKIARKIPMRTYNDFTPTLSEIRNECGNDSFDLEVLSDTLITEVMKAFAKEKGFTAKRGKDLHPGKRLIS